MRGIGWAGRSLLVFSGAVVGADIALGDLGQEVPTVVTKVSPSCPTGSCQDDSAGVVVLKALVGRDGRVGDLRADRSFRPCDSSVLAAARPWPFLPVIAGEKSVRVWVAIKMSFPPHYREVATIDSSLSVFGSRARKKNSPPPVTRSIGTSCNSAPPNVRANRRPTDGEAACWASG